MRRRLRRLTLEPDEVLELHRERRREQRDVDELARPSPARDERREHPVASRKPAVRSAIGIPPARTGTVSPGEACAVSSPARAWATRS